MAQQDFPGLPEDIYEYRNQFNYSVWVPDTEVVCCNVPWDSAYRDVVRFDNSTARENYFNSLAGYTIRLDNMVYLKYGEPVRVNIPFNRINNCNYLFVRNRPQPVPGDFMQPDVFYYFIKDVEYIAPNTTQLNVQLDIWQTYYSRISFNYCYVNKGHLGIANENSNKSNLASYLTDAEGLNIGDEYEVVHQEFINFTEAGSYSSPYILVMSTTDLESDWGNKDAPVLKTAKGTTNEGLPNGCRVYAMNGSNFLRLMQQLSNAPWVSQGINLITAVPKPFVRVGSSPVELGNGVDAYRLRTGYTQGGESWTIADVFSKFNIPSRYSKLLKMFCSPYCIIEMSGINGGEIVLKPECLKNDSGNDELVIQSKSVCAPPDIRAYVFPDRYNEAPNTDTSFRYGFMPPAVTIGGNLPYADMYGGEGFDMALQFTNWPQFAIVNNMYLNYMASTVNTRNYSFQAADWSQQKALTAASLSFNQSTNSMNTALENQAIANNANWGLSGISQEKNLWGGLQGVMSAQSTAANGAVSGAMSAGAGGAAVGAALGAANGVVNMGGAVLNTALNADWINRTTATQVGAATQLTQNNVANQAYMRDTNYDYANFAARGDYETAIQGIQAKVQDAKLTQPSTSGQNGGDAFNMANGYCGVVLKWKRLKPNFMRQIGDFWLRYGYYVNRWVVPPQDLKCMTNFTYWKMQYVNLSSSPMPELFKESIRGIFEKGVTVWNDPNMINKIDLAENDIVEGVRY